MAPDQSALHDLLEMLPVADVEDRITAVDVRAPARRWNGATRRPVRSGLSPAPSHQTIAAHNRDAIPRQSGPREFRGVLQQRGLARPSITHHGEHRRFTSRRSHQAVTNRPLFSDPCNQS
jgi:hypothetical protein